MGVLTINHIGPHRATPDPFQTAVIVLVHFTLLICWSI